MHLDKPSFSKTHGLRHTHPAERSTRDFIRLVRSGETYLIFSMFSLLPVDCFYEEVKLIIENLKFHLTFTQLPRCPHSVSFI